MFRRWGLSAVVVVGMSAALLGGAAEGVASKSAPRDNGDLLAQAAADGLPRYRFKVGEVLRYAFTFSQNNHIVGAPGQPPEGVKLGFEVAADLLAETTAQDETAATIVVKLEGVKVTPQGKGVPVGPVRAALTKISFQMRVAPDGATSDFKTQSEAPPQMAEFVQTIEQTVRQLFPRLPPAAPKGGMTYSEKGTNALPLPNGSKGSVAYEYAFTVTKVEPAILEVGMTGPLAFDSPLDGDLGAKPLEGAGDVKGAFTFDRAAGRMIKAKADSRQKLALRTPKPDGGAITMDADNNVTYSLTLKP